LNGGTTNDFTPVTIVNSTDNKGVYLIGGYGYKLPVSGKFRGKGYTRDIAVANTGIQPDGQHLILIQDIDTAEFRAISICGTDGYYIIAVQQRDIHTGNFKVIAAGPTRTRWQWVEVAASIDGLIDTGCGGIVNSASVVRSGGDIDYSVLNLSRV